MLKKICRLTTDTYKPIILVNEKKINRVFKNSNREDIKKQHEKNRKSASRLNIVNV